MHLGSISWTLKPINFSSKTWIPPFHHQAGFRFSIEFELCERGLVALQSFKMYQAHGSCIDFLPRENSLSVISLAGVIIFGFEFRRLTV